MNPFTKKFRLTIEIAASFILMAVFSTIFNRIAIISNTDGLWVGILSYLLSALAIILYVINIEKKPASYMGFRNPSFLDIPKGILLGTCMFVSQQIPLLLMNVDYSIFSKEPNWGNIATMSI